jgi:cyclopropane-fatty-acyl-phospholipid synthase
MASSIPGGGGGPFSRRRRDDAPSLALGSALRLNLPVLQVANWAAYPLQLALVLPPVLGRRLKYSCAHWPEGVDGLDAAEESMLQLTCERAGLADGQRILELGCGWGSLTLWMAERYPRSRITAVSNSSSQKAHTDAEAARRGLDNVMVVTADMNRFTSTERFDRVVSVEMFEHMRNYEALLGRIASWLEPGGRLFVHIFSHSGRVPLRGPGRGRLDDPALLHGRPDALPRPPPVLPA